MKFMQIEPQPARGKLVESMWDDPNWIAEEKYDGDRRIAQFCGKVVRFTGRRKSVKDGLFVEKTENVPHLSGVGSEEVEVLTRRAFKSKDQPAVHLGNEILRRVKPPSALDGTVLDGEMILDPGIRGTVSDKVTSEGRSKYVTSILGSLPEEAVRKQIERGWLRYVVFDCLFFKGRDIRKESLAERRAQMMQIIREWGNPFVETSEAFGSNKRAFLKDVLARGGEGVILKNEDHKYGDKNGWVKVKAEWTADVVIMGFKDAKEMSKKKGEDAPTMTKYAKAGLIGAIVCGQYKPALSASENARFKLTEVATVSGMDDDLRAHITKYPDQYLKRVVEIAHNGREPTGRFRHPRFKRFRDDKRAKDCIYREGEI